MGDAVTRKVLSESSLSPPQNLSTAMDDLLEQPTVVHQSAVNPAEEEDDQSVDEDDGGPDWTRLGWTSTSRLGSHPSYWFT